MKNNVQNGVIEAPVDTAKIRKVYNALSHVYSMADLVEKKARTRGVELANIKPGDKVLEVAVGVGGTFSEILKRVRRDSTVHGIDLSPKMLEKTRKLAIKNGYRNFDLREGDARRMPYADETFDVLYNSYMLDLIPLADIPVVLKEFRRVLKVGGRLILVNFSKKDASPNIVEKIYKINPYLWAGCRPVLMESFAKEAGFRNVKREIPKEVLPSEIVTAVK